MSKIVRSPKDQAVMGTDVTGTVVNPRAGAVKALAVGPQFQMGSATAQVSGIDASAGIQMSPGTTMWLYNNSGTVAWATMATTAPSAPSSIATGIPLKPNDWTQLNMGEYSFLRTSAATVGVYIVADETSFRVIPDGQTF